MPPIVNIVKGDNWRCHDNNNKATLNKNPFFASVVLLSKDTLNPFSKYGKHFNDGTSRSQAIRGNNKCFENKNKQSTRQILFCCHFCSPL